jgi:hypothetical protein
MTKQFWREAAILVAGLNEAGKERAIRLQNLFRNSFGFCHSERSDASPYRDARARDVVRSRDNDAGVIRVGKKIVA